MSNDQKYKSIFIKSLGINDSSFNEKLNTTKYPSGFIGHMTLMSGLEEEFGITLETDDIVDFSSFKKGKEILGKYKISFLVRSNEG